MGTVRLLDITSLLASLLRQREVTNQTNKAAQQQEAQAIASPEVRLLAVDSSVLTSQQFNGSGTFTFTWTQNEDGSAQLDITLETGESDQAVPEGVATSNFSLSLRISADGKVELPAGVQADLEQISGQDFSYSNGGVLQLLSDLAQRMGAEEQAQVDLTGKLDDTALQMLKRLGLVDSGGRATQLLQFLSDYAGLDRFKTGQQISQSSDTAYGLSEKSLATQRLVLYSLRMTIAAAPTTGAEAAAQDSSTTAGVTAAASAQPTATAEAVPAETPAAGETSGGNTGLAAARSLLAAGQSAPAAPAGEAAAAEETTSSESATPSNIPGAARGVSTISSTVGSGIASSTLEDTIEALEAALAEKERQASQADQEAKRLEYAAGRQPATTAGPSGKDQPGQEAERARQVADQRQQAVVQARMAVASAKLQLEQAAGQS